MLEWIKSRLPWRQFRPGIFYHEEDRITEVILKDCFTVWHPLQGSLAHFVDLGYNSDDELVGIRIWGDVREPRGCTRSIHQGAELLRTWFKPRDKGIVTPTAGE